MLTELTITRRDMIALGTIAVCGCACGSLAIAAEDDKKPKRPEKLVIGKLADYADVKFYDAFAKQKLMVRRLPDRLIAMSATCTHKGCTVRIDKTDADALRCPCHKGMFSEQGTPTDGPPKFSLVRFAISADASGEITIDTTRSFEERQWDDPAAFIALPAK